MNRLLFLFCLLFLNVASTYAQEEITVYDWQTYDNPTIIDMFEKETGIKVNKKTFVTDIGLDQIIDNDENIDVLVTSHYLLHSWITKNKINQLDLSKLNNYQNLDKNYITKLAGIPKANNYAVPYISNMSLMALKKDVALPVFKTVDNIPKTWGLLFDEKYLSNVESCKIALMDNPLYVYSVYALYEARSFTSFNETLLKQLNSHLFKLKHFYGYIDNKEVLGGFRDQGDVCAAIARSSYAGDMGSNVVLVEPEEGVPLTMDVMVIPKKSKNVTNAYKFIDFMLQHNIAKTLAEDTQGIVAVSGVQKLVDAKFKDNKFMFPDEKSLRRMFLLRSINDQDKALLKDAWMQFKK